MESKQAITALAALAQETRLAIYRYLIQAGEAGVAAGQISESLHLPAATLSFHLKTLRQADLLLCAREGRSLLYRVNYAMMNQLVAYLLESCCSNPPTAFCLTDNLISTDDTNLSDKESFMSNNQAYNILFLCTGNSARSIMAESLAQHWGKGRFNAYSAGSNPTGEVNPLALELLERLKMPTEGLRSKSWSEFSAAGAPHMDFVITVCDNAANEVCPVWPGQPMTAHWGAPDPAAVQGERIDKMQAMREAFRILENRIKIFTSLSIQGLEKLKLKEKMDEIGNTHPQAES